MSTRIILLIILLMVCSLYLGAILHNLLMGKTQKLLIENLRLALRQVEQPRQRTSVTIEQAAWLLHSYREAVLAVERTSVIPYYDSSGERRRLHEAQTLLLRALFRGSMW